MRGQERCTLACIVALGFASALHSVWAGDGSWAVNNSGNWSGASNWAGNALADGAGATAWFTNNITATRTVTIDTTPRTLGILNLGDGSDWFILAATGGGSLTFDNGSGHAQIHQLSASRGNIINSTLPVVLASSLDIDNAATGGVYAFTLSGGLTGSGNLALHSDSPGGITLSSGALNHAGAITNAGTSTGITTISGGVGSNVTAIVQASTNSPLTINTLPVTVNSTGTTLINLNDTGAVLSLSANTGVAGTGDLILRNNGTLNNGITVACPVTNAGQVVNAGTGTGSNLITGVIGASVTAVVQNSASSPLTLNASNAFTNGLVIKAGTVLGLTSPNVFGMAPGVVTLGDALVGADAMLVAGTATTFIRPIVAAPAGAARLILSNAAACVFGGPITLNNDLWIASGSTLNTVTGGVTGVGNIILQAGSAGIAISTVTLNPAGAITNAGTGAGAVTISGGVGANVTTIVQSSGSSSLTIGTTPLTVNSNGATLVNASAGVALLTVSGGVNGVGSLTLRNNSAANGGITVAGGVVNHLGTVTNSGTGGDVWIGATIGSNVTAVVENSASSGMGLSALTVNANGTMLVNNNAAGGALLTVTNGVTGAGSLTLRNNSAIVSGITVSGGMLNSAGIITNAGTGSGSILIGSVIGTNASLVQNSVTSTLILRGANVYTGGTVIAAGTLCLDGASAGTGPVTIQSGGRLQGTGTAAGTVTNELGGRIAPGTDGMGYGTLTMGNLTWKGGGVFHCEVGAIDGKGGAGGDYDRIVVSGAMNAVPAGSNLVIRLDTLGQTLPFETNRNYVLKVISYASAPGLNPADITLDTNAFLVGGVWSLTNLNNAIYVICLGATSTNKNYWIGSGNWSASTNWSLGHAPLPGEDVEFDFRHVSNCTANSVTNDLGSLTLSPGYTGTVTIQTKYPTWGSTNVSITGDCTIQDGVVTHPANTGGATAKDCLRLTIGGNLSIGVDGQINVDGKGYAANQGPAGVITTQGGRGPSHGGLGGQGTSYTAPLPTYGSMFDPVTLGSGGGTASSGSQGGGSVRITVMGTTTLEGAITAAGVPDGYRYAGGSGGSIFLTTGRLQGSGRIVASGRGSLTANTASGGGGGGRVAVVLTASSTFGNVSINAPGGTDASGAPGAAGTVYLQTQSQARGEGTLIVDNAGSVISYWVATQMPEPSAYNDTPDLSHLAAIVVTNGGRLWLNTNTVYSFAASNLQAHGFANSTVIVGGTNVSFPDPFTVSTNYRLLISTTISAAGNWTVSSNAVLSQAANYYATDPYRLGLILNGNLTVEAGGAINVDGRGCKPGGGLAAGTTSNNGIGAGYGGMGGWGGSTNAPNGPALPTYGSITAPTQCGSGANLAGNGAILLDIRGTTTVYGILSARQTNNAAGQGGASGGTIWLRTAALRGTGSLDVSGQPASYSASGSVGSGGGGGGGRLALILTGSDSFDGIQMSAAGGPNITAGYAYDSAAAGTIYAETRSQGSLKGQVLIANSNKDLGPNTNVVTWLPAPTNAVVNELAHVTVVLSNRAYVALSTNLTIGDLFIRTNTPNFLYLKGCTLTVNHARHPDWGSTNNVVADGGQIIWKEGSSILIVH